MHGTALLQMADIHYKFASGYGAGKNTFLYRGHVFFLDKEVW